MDPVTLVVTALALGAAAGLKDTAAQTVKDAYTGVKTLILRKYGDVGLGALEKKPDSHAKQDSVAEDLADAGAGQDEELILQAQALAELVEQYVPEAAAEINVSVSDIEGIRNFRIADVKASGDAAKIDVDVENVKADGDFTIEGLEAKGGKEPDPKN